MRRFPLGVFARMLLYVPLVWPHLLFFGFSKNKLKIMQDVKCSKIWPVLTSEGGICSLWFLLVFFKEFRSVFYMRTQKSWFATTLMQWMLPPLRCCQLGTSDNIEGGFCLVHGFGVVINTDVKIGSNCTVLQGTTIGEDWKGGVPIIGNDVFIGCNSVIIGGVSIGDNAKIGAGSVVVTDVPAGSTVVGDKAHVVKRGVDAR